MTFPANSSALSTAASRTIAKYLLEIGAVKFSLDEPFTWVSGIKSPIYCDNRVINSSVHVRDAVIAQFSNLILEKYLDDTDIIAGVATGGIPYGVLTADRLKLPFIYIREKRKEHGLMKAVEGAYREGDRVVLIEDHISTGKSSLTAIKNMREEGLKLTALVSIMTYGFQVADRAFASEEVEHTSICNLDTVLEVAREQGILNSSQVDTVFAFRESRNKS